MSPRWRLIIFFGVILVLIAVVTAILLGRRTPLEAFGEFEGPLEDSQVAAFSAADWRDYSGGEDARLAIFLTQSDSAWLGLAHGLKSIGVPFIITDDASQAVRHEMVIAYPLISGRAVSGPDLDLLRAHVESGGVLFATQILGGGMQDLFGFESAVETRENYEVVFAPGNTETAFLDDPREQTVRLGNPDRPETWIGAQEFSGAGTVLASYQDGDAAFIVNHRPDGGAAYALGFDLGFFILKAQNDRDAGASRTYANAYEPSVDTWLRVIRDIYRRHEPLAATIHPAPAGKQLAAIVSFDVDYSRSILNMGAYRDLLAERDLAGTFFIQTKYYRDYFDQGFFNDTTLAAVESLTDEGMEVASHSVSHTDTYASLPLGDGRERYPEYQPRVVGEGETQGATVLGEMRVSKYLLEAITGQDVVSFRPGYLATPNTMPQALESSGYRFASSVTAGNVLTHLPYQMTYDRKYGGQTSIYQFPIAVEDEIPPPMEERVDSAIQLARTLGEYGGVFIILTHPDVLDGKLRFLEEIIPAIEPFAWFGTLEQYGAWWAARDALEIDLVREGETLVVSIDAPAAVNGVTVTLPESWTPSGALPEGTTYSDGKLLLGPMKGDNEIRFTSGEERP